MISPAIGSEAAELVAQTYRDAELRILRRLTTTLADGIDEPGWESLALGRLQRLRHEILGELAATNPAAVAAITDEIDAAYAQGQASAYRDAGERLEVEELPTAARRAAVRALANDVTTGLAAATPGILRASDDVYRATVAAATGSILAGAEGRREAAQRTIRELVGKGLKVVETKRGSLTTADYVTMAVRTATARAALDGHTESAGDLGLDLVVIHPGPRACKVCDTWARAVLHRTEATLRPSGTYRTESLTTGKPITVDAWRTLAEARAAGWGHPNCRCGLKSYLPGITKPEELQRPPWDRKGYEAQQQQREIERQIRAWKTREATAMTTADRKESALKVRAWQEQMRGHLAEHPQLKRQSIREQAGKLYGGNPNAARNPPDGGPRIPADPAKPVRSPTEPASTTPKLDARKTLTDQDDRQEQLKRANPLYGTDPNYGINCTHCVSTMELRTRGYDLQALPLPREFSEGGRMGRPAADILRTWRTPEGGTAAYRQVNSRNITNTRRAITDAGPGSRWWVTVAWKGGGAHIFTAENVGGKVVFSDPQDPTRDASTYISRARPGQVWIARVDDLTPTDDVLEFSEPTLSAAKLKAARAQADAEAEAKRKRQEQASLERQRIRERAEALRRTDPAADLRRRITEDRARLEQYRGIMAADTYEFFQQAIVQNIRQLEAELTELLRQRNR